MILTLLMMVDALLKLTYKALLKVAAINTLNYVISRQDLYTRPKRKIMECLVPHKT
jgi:hypothetical protein